MNEQRSKTAMVLAGGGIMGAAYEIGCLTALDRLFRSGFSTRRFDTYIGISAGSVIASLVANRIQPGGLSEPSLATKARFSTGDDAMFITLTGGQRFNLWQVCHSIFCGSSNTIEKTTGKFV
jgi:predicted acylesterase/phospholipase RssA